MPYAADVKSYRLNILYNAYLAYNFLISLRDRMSFDSTHEEFYFL